MILRKNLSDYLLLSLKGLSMGAVDAVPGVSGGTIAFITGIYDELLESINSIDAEAMRLLFKFRLPEFWKKINGNFLLILVASMTVGIVINLILIDYLLKHYPILVWSFFFGLIMVSTPLILRDVKTWSFKIIFMLLLGAVLGYAITLGTPVHTSNALWFIFLCGAIAISAMILPGISGAFILLLLGKYQYMANALHHLNIPVVVVFIAGCIAGILSFSRFLSWILRNYHHATVALLAGFMVGSLNKVWPWREITEYTTNSKGEQIPALDRSVWPWDYFAITGKDPLIFQSVMMIALGVFIVVLIEKMAARLKTKI